MPTTSRQIPHPGVGGDMPGDAQVREKYKMKPNKEYTYTFRISPIK